MPSDESQRIGNQQGVGATQCDYTKVGKQTGNLYAFGGRDYSLLDRVLVKLKLDGFKLVFNVQSRLFLSPSNAEMI